MATTPAPLVFSGNDNENLQNFLHEVERYIQLTRIIDEATKVILFGTFISAGSQADIWWGSLTAQQTASWAAIKAAFEMQWPAIVVAAKSTLDYQKELLTLRLKEDDIGERITVAGVSTRSHLHYHGCLQKLVQDAGVVNTPVFIHQVCKALPHVMWDLMSPAPATWTVFLNEIKDVKIDIIQDKARREKERREKEKVQNLGLTKLESMQTDPVKILHLQMQHMTIGPANNPSPITMNTQPRLASNTNMTHNTLPNPANSMSTRCQMCYVTTNQNTTQRPRGQPPTQKEQDAMRTCINELVHQPDMSSGQAAYIEQVRQWEMPWGSGTRCSEQTPYPLMPGTAQICSGECFRCGLHRHIGPECQVLVDDQLLKNESIWRGLYTCTLGTFNRATAPQVNIVFEDAYAPTRGDQGNGSGLSV
jgi:hypothetical protein